MNKKIIISAVTIFCLLLIVSCSPQYRIIAIGNEIQTDPDIVSGILPNGFQYLIKKNPVPDDRVFIYLNIFAGSLNETEEQQGVAHYLEHMMFNGSKHFKPGELIEYFQSIGMEFGSDANAHTNFFNTVYNLSLPGGNQEDLENAFSVIEDYAEGASLLDSEIDRERGIILAEKRERDSVTYQTLKKTLEFELPGSLLNQRYPIGNDSVIRQADQKLLKDYYKRWYRPDNMALVVVGDFDTKTAEKLIIERFSKLSTHSFGVNSLSSIRWKEHEKTKAFYHYEPEAGRTNVILETISWKEFEPETLEMLKLNTLIEITHLMLQHRLIKMVNDQTGGFSDVSVFSGSYMRNVSMSAIHTSCEPEKWQETLRNIGYTLQQGLIFGFEENELDRVKAEYLSDLEMKKNQEGTQRSQDIAENILSAISNKEMLLSAKQRKDILEPYINSISLKDANDALFKSWSKKPKLIIVTGNADLENNDPEDEIQHIYQKSSMEKIEKYNESELKKFPYLDMPEPTTQLIIKRTDNVQGLGITTIDFENNVRLNLKCTDYKKNEILFKVCFGEGKKSEPESKPGISYISESVINKSGLGQLNADQMEEALAGHQINFIFDINENHFSFSGSCDPGDMEILFQLIYHHLMDPGVRNQALDLSKIHYQQMYNSLLRKPEGIMQIKGGLFLGGNDPRLGFPEPSKIEQYSLNDVKDWLIPYINNSPVEVSIVGDINTDKVISHAFKYLGLLNRKGNDTNIIGHQKQVYFPEGQQLDLVIDTKIETGVVHVAFLTDDFWNI
ncbi:MAG: pitrilysin family protein, partial [Desulfobacula sp.]